MIHGVLWCWNLETWQMEDGRWEHGRVRFRREKGGLYLWPLPRADLAESLLPEVLILHVGILGRVSCPAHLLWWLLQMIWFSP